MVVTATYCKSHKAQLRTIGKLQPLRKSPPVRLDKEQCSFEGCQRHAYAHTLCNAHYSQWYRGAELSELRHSNVGKVCEYDLCDRPASTKSLCPTHYTQMKNGQEMVPVGLHQRPWTAQRILEEAEEIGGCLVWGAHRKGRASVKFQGRDIPAYRVVFQELVDDAIDGIAIHHKCANAYCVKPDHLEKASAAHNTLEMLGRRAYEAEIKLLKARIAELEAQISIYEEGSDDGTASSRSVDGRADVA